MFVGIWEEASTNGETEESGNDSGENLLEDVDGDGIKGACRGVSIGKEKGLHPRQE